MASFQDYLAQLYAQNSGGERNNFNVNAEIDSYVRGKKAQRAQRSLVDSLYALSNTEPGQYPGLEADTIKQAGLIQAGGGEIPRDAVDLANSFAQARIAKANQDAAAEAQAEFLGAKNPEIYNTADAFPGSQPYYYTRKQQEPTKGYYMDNPYRAQLEIGARQAAIEQRGKENLANLKGYYDVISAKQKYADPSASASEEFVKGNYEYADDPTKAGEAMAAFQQGYRQKMRQLEQESQDVPQEDLTLPPNSPTKAKPKKQPTASPSPQATETARKVKPDLHIQQVEVPSNLTDEEAAYLRKIKGK